MSRERDLRASGPLQVAAGLVVIACVAMTAQNGVTRHRDPVGVRRGFIAVGEILRITLPGGRQAAPLASAGALAFALLPSFRGHPDFSVSIALAVTVVTFGSVIGAFPRTLVGRGMQLDELARRVITTLVAAALFQPRARRPARPAAARLDAGCRP